MTEPKKPKLDEDNTQQPQDEELNYQVLKDVCENNAKYFEHDRTENGQRMYLSLLAIQDNVDAILPKIKRIRAEMHRFDFDEDTPGNGYRSFLSVVDSAVQYGLHLNNRVLQKRASLLFRRTAYTKDVESCSHLLSSLDTCLKRLETLLASCKDDCLFTMDRELAQNMLETCEEINQYAFYGRLLGFQYCETLKNVLRVIALSMVIFSEGFYSRGSMLTKATNTVMTSTKYISDPELRSRRVVNISQHAGVDFCKAFWFLAESEIMSQVPAIVSPTVAVSKIVNIPPEPLTIRVEDRDIEIPVPTSHIGKKPIQVRLISYEIREGMIGEATNTKAKPQSPCLLLHCHGGGFVAQSSRSHECYLRHWAKQLNVPILSIDYSLAPEAPFPRALEEITYAYCWAMKNHQFLGSTGENIVAAGDSAGANLLLSMSLKCASLDIPPPKGVFAAYVPTLVNFMPSPSRLLCMMDPLLPLGFLMRCLKAYAIPDVSKIVLFNQTAESSDTESFEEITESDLADLQAHKSPVSDASDTLTFGSFSANLNDEKDEFDVSDVERSQKYVSDFLDKYALDSDTETDATKLVLATQNTQESTSSSRSLDSLHSRVTMFVTNIKDHLNSFLGSKRSTSTEDGPDLEHLAGLLEECNFDVPPNPFLSPYLASDELLIKLPPIKILTVEMDPCLDDGVVFAKRLKKLNKNITLDILKGLPHGFLNFSLISKDAYEGSKLCVKRIKELFDLNLKDSQKFK